MEGGRISDYVGANQEGVAKVGDKVSVRSHMEGREGH